ncbi:MAG TPA: helix-turn-helix domain-containing protein [Gemmatimonadaceae bacterium]|jgi:AcrR family transcriptional regulator
MASSTRPRRLSSADWIKAATELLVDEGITAVAVEPIAARLGATKGSFYHHFRNRDALIAATLESWEREQTETVIERLRLIRDPRERLRAVMKAAVTDRSGGLRDAAFLNAAQHRLVRPVVVRVTTRRLGYMAESFGELGMSKAEAQRRALLLYLSYLGLFNYVNALDVELSDAKLEAYAEEVVRTLVPDGQATVRGRKATH